MTVYINGVGGGASAVEVRTEIDSNSTRLDANMSSRAPSGEYTTEMARIDVDVSSRNATTPPTVVQVRTEMDSNSTRLSAIEADTTGINGEGMRGTNNASLASAWTAALATILGNFSAARIGYIDELAAANLPTDVAAIPTTAMRGTENAALASVCTDTRLARLTQDVTVGIKKGVAYTIVFKMVDATDFATPETGITVVETISKDGGAFNACTNTFAEIANGWYKILLTATEMNANEIIFKGTSAGCAQSDRLIVTES